jgi:hypothetical protein
MHLFPTKALTPNARQRLLAGENSRDSKDGAVQQDVAEFEVDPVPEEETLEGSEGEDERQDAWRQEMRRARGDLGPLFKLCTGMLVVWGVAKVRIKTYQA